MVFADPVAANISISYAGVNVGPTQFINVFYAIKSRRILAFYDHSKTYVKDPGTAVYQSNYDVLFVARRIAPLMENSFAGLYQRSAILHELVHAVLDAAKSKVSRIEDEKLAYVFQAAYLRQSSFAGNAIPNAVADPGIFPAAFAIADTMAAGNQPTAQQDAALDKAIRMHPDYLTVFLPLLHDGIR
jgi:hypothetical protein